jgi:M6 family metalloprotease-like protein
VKKGGIMTRSRISFLALIFTGLFITALMVPARAIAVPASPDVHVLEQPDGATFNALQWGDENRHGWETDDGYTIVFEEKMNRWTYARHDFNGNLVGTAYIAGKDLPPFDMPKNLRPARKPAVTMMTSKEWALAAPSLSPSLGAPAPQGIGGPQLLVPSTGTGNIPVVLVNFSDRTTTYTPAQFNNLIFGAGDYSMMGYYDEVSYGLFEIAPGPSSLAQWYAASGTHNYYGGSQTLWATLAKDTAQLAGAAGFDFTAYDTDGDCKVDVLAVIHQGPGQEATGNINDVWSHRWSLSGAGIGAYDTGQTCAADNAQHVIVDDYIIMPEKYGTGMSTMGVFAHEYGHSFGLPDLYDTDYTSEGVGKWSLMAAGSWNYVTRPGDRPAHMDAWCKYFLGWVNPTLVTSPLFYEPVTAAETTPDVYQFLSGSPTGGGEYFLVENRQKIGFDAGLPGSGLLIWHIDESQPSNDCAIFPFYYGGFWYWFDESTYLGNPDCTPSSHYHVALLHLWRIPVLLG